MPELVWFITGCSSGFGRRLVTSALARGDRVIATARNLAKLVIPEPYDPDHLRKLQLDVTAGPEAIQLRVDEAIGIWGRIDVLVNNAGSGVLGLLEEGGSTLLEEQFKTNLYGAFDVTNAVLPHLRARKSGTVVVIGSRSSWRPELAVSFVSGVVLSIVAHLFSSLAETFTVELEPFGIRVLIVEPGAFRTENIYATPCHMGYPISDLDELRAHSLAVFKAVDGQQNGDPAKAMEAVVDVVRGEGKAKGRPWPTYLVLGDDAERDIRAKIQKMLDTLDAWADVTRGTNFDS
ncbi:hypothetical protein PLICRDRAFT_668304 [Plicaturopsis crispa FD-325 SS-3]|nr:hypothetical protein PLICRDRAFT_668304 [Plicaturopsis crispa FD-325 SS-3]